MITKNLPPMIILDNQPRVPQFSMLMKSQTHLDIYRASLMQMTIFSAF